MFPQAERDDFFAALDSFFMRTHAAAQAAQDSAAADYLEPGNRWNPMIDAISTYINGCELDQVSVKDFEEYEDTEINWRVPRGYGALIVAYGAPCNVALNCNVTRIDHSGARGLKSKLRLAC